MNCQAARQQADGVEDRSLEHFARSRSADALSQIKQIRNYKDRKDRGLSHNEARHCDLAAIRKAPARRCLKKRICHCTHWFLPLFVSAVWIFGMLQVPQRPTARDDWNG